MHCEGPTNRGLGAQPYRLPFFGSHPCFWGRLQGSSYVSMGLEKGYGYTMQLPFRDDL